MAYQTPNLYSLALGKVAAEAGTTVVMARKKSESLMSGGILRKVFKARCKA
jgi:hypothetical protein